MTTLTERLYQRAIASDDECRIDDADLFRAAADMIDDLLEALVKLNEAGRTAWHFQHRDTNAQLGFATALTQSSAAIAKATGA